MKRLAVILAIVLAGCATGSPPPNANDTVVLSRNIAHGAPLWRVDATRRIEGRPVLLVVHGGTLKGQWQCFPDDGPAMPVESAVRLLKAVFPGREVLVVSCNRDGKRLDVPGTWYAKSMVWSRPYTFAPWQLILPDPDDAIGAIEEFEHNP